MTTQTKILMCLTGEILLCMAPVMGVQAGRDAPYYHIDINGGNFEPDESGIYHYFIDGKLVTDAFFCDGTYTYYLESDGSPMANRLTYHPDGEKDHIIYFDSEGHEVFDSFAHVKQSIAGDPVDDLCFFNSLGFLYVDVLTYGNEKYGTETELYYANQYGVMEVGKWFQFSDTVQWADGTSAIDVAGKYGYATEYGSLMTSTWAYNWNNRAVYLQANGTVATGLLYDGNNYYVLDDHEGYVIEVIPGEDTNTTPTDPTKPTAKYSYSLKTLNQYDIYTDVEVILALLTDNPDKSKIQLSCSDDMEGVVLPLFDDVKYLDDSYSTSEWQEIKSQTGYIRTISFKEPGVKDIVIKEQVDGHWIEVEKLTIVVKDRKSAEDAWFRNAIESETDASMTDYDKMFALNYYVKFGFSYLPMDDSKHLLFLATHIGPWWEVKEISCWDATSIMCEFATRLGLKSEPTYAGYDAHEYATVYIDGKAYKFDASPFPDNVTEWDYILE